MKNFILLFLTLFVFDALFAQQSLILEQQLIDCKNHPQVFQEEQQGLFKAPFQALERIDIYEITYRSDSLAIQAFAAIPKKEGKYPVIK